MNTNYTSRDFESLKKEMIQKLDMLAPELTNRNESEFTMVMIELFAYTLDLLSYSLDRYALETLLFSATQRENIIKLCKNIGYRLENRIPSTVLNKFYIDEPHTHDIIIPRLTKASTSGRNILTFETLNSVILPQGSTSIEVLSIQGVTKNEVIGQSDGSTNQTFIIPDNEVLDGVRIFVNETEFEYVDNFIGSESYDNHFTTQIINNKMNIIFGNNLNGSIPQSGSNIESIYRVGGGAISNVGPNTIIKLRSNIYDSLGEQVVINVINEQSASGGKDPETIESAKIKAPSQIYTLWRAVSKGDFERLALLNDGVIQATEIEKSKRSVDVHVLIENEEDIPLLKKAQLEEFFNERKLIGYTVNIKPADYKYVDIVLNVEIYPNKTNLELQTQIENLVNESLSLGKIQFGKKILEGEVIKSIMQLSDVKNATIQISNNSPNKNEIIRLNSLQVDVTGGV